MRLYISGPITGLPGRFAASQFEAGIALGQCKPVCELDPHDELTRLRI